jgi:hypothetical protein
LRTAEEGSGWRRRGGHGAQSMIDGRLSQVGRSV